MHRLVYIFAHIKSDWSVFSGASKANPKWRCYAKNQKKKMRNALLPNGSFCTDFRNAVLLCIDSIIIECVPSYYKCFCCSQVSHTFKCNRMQNCYLSMHQRFRFSIDSVHCQCICNALTISSVQSKPEISFYNTHAKKHTNTPKLRASIR